MMNRLFNTVAALTTVSLFLLACGQGNDPANDPSQPSDPSGPSDVIAQTYSVSECGGFNARSAASYDDGDEPQQAEKTAPTEPTDPTDPAISDYCAAEVLQWSHDAATGTLKLANTRVMLNCCGLHSITIEKKGDVYQIREKDEPEMFDGQPSRCLCSCPFDFALEAKDMPAGEIEIEVVREVTDGNPAEEVVFSGKLDLSSGQGSVEVNGEPAMMCEQ